MPSELVREITVSISDCDARGHWRPSAMLVQMQEMAEVHAAGFGLSRAHLIEGGVCWVLYRQRVEIHKALTFGEVVRMTTWPAAIEGPIFPRHYVMEAADGSRVMEAATSWILMDIHTRRPMRPSALPGKLPQNLDRVAPLPLPGMLRIDGAQAVGERPVLYSDLDVNGHMNNARYIDWICDMLPLEDVLDRGVAAFQINYISEGRPGEAIALARRDEDGKIFVQGKRAADGRPVFEAYVRLGNGGA